MEERGDSGLREKKTIRSGSGIRWVEWEGALPPCGDRHLPSKEAGRRRSGVERIPITIMNAIGGLILVWAVIMGTFLLQGVVLTVLDLADGNLAGVGSVALGYGFVVLLYLGGRSCHYFSKALAGAHVASDPRKIALRLAKRWIFELCPLLAWTSIVIGGVSFLLVVALFVQGKWGHALSTMAVGVAMIWGGYLALEAAERYARVLARRVID